MCIHRLRKGLRAGVERRTVVLCEEVRSGRGVCEGGEGHVRRTRDRSEVWRRVDGGRGVRQGSPLSPFFFAVITMDRLTKEIRQKAPRATMLSDNVVICGRGREGDEIELRDGNTQWKEED